LPDELKARPEGEVVISTLPTGNVGANESPLKLESDGAVSSNENLKEAGGVLLLSVSVIP
jgi:hypothetical protein